MPNYAFYVNYAFFRSSQPDPESARRGRKIPRSVTHVTLKHAVHPRPEAQLQLGLIYGLGEDGVRKNAFKATKWYLAAARQGMPEAQFLVGLRYRDGEGVARDAAEAVRWMRAAAEHGHIDAQANLAEAYLEGDGVEPDFEEAARWYRAAAEGGDPDAPFNLGMMYADCLADMEDDPDAEEWLKVAAAAGHEAAQYLLGELGAAGYPGIDDDESSSISTIRSAVGVEARRTPSGHRSHRALGFGIPTNHAVTRHPTDVQAYLHRQL